LSADLFDCIEHAARFIYLASYFKLEVFIIDTIEQPLSAVEIIVALSYESGHQAISRQNIDLFRQISCAPAPVQAFGSERLFPIRVAVALTLDSQTKTPPLIEHQLCSLVTAGIALVKVLLRARGLQPVFLFGDEPINLFDSALCSAALIIQLLQARSSLFLRRP
jgi:hypothetical protein